MNIKRPSHKELNKKFLQAKGSLYILNQHIIAADALNLGYLIEEIYEVLIEILTELKPDYYAGSYPPQRSYETEIKESELFVFRWTSGRFGCDTYFKFALKQGHLWIVSLHEHREK